MIRHLFKLIWNRKGANFLIMLEVFASFLVVFALAATALHLAISWSRPLGFDWKDVWTVNVERNDTKPWSGADAAVFKRLIETARAHPEVVEAAGASTVPYGGSVSIYSWNVEGRKVEAEVSVVTPGLEKVLGIDLVAGRWFEPADEALGWTPVIVDRDMARQLVGDGDPLKARIPQKDNPEMRVVGVVSDFRRGGELMDDGAYMLAPAMLDKQATEAQPPSLWSLVMRLEPGTTAAFEEPLMKSLQAVAHGWSFQIVHMDAARESRLRGRLGPLVGVGLVAAFLLLMVVLGLTGVMWQNVTRRTREFGLRRAVGADRTRIQRQIVGEVAVTAGLGILVGSLVAVQTPLIGAFSFVPFSEVLSALAAAAALMLVLAAVCGLYPGWSATKIHPAEALHYE